MCFFVYPERSQGGLAFVLIKCHDINFGDCNEKVIDDNGNLERPYALPWSVVHL